MKKMVWVIFLMIVLCFQNAKAQKHGKDFRKSYIANKITFALTGDAIITRKLSPYKEPQFKRMIKIIRSADVAYTNLEMLFHNYGGYPSAHSGGTWMRAEPSLVNELTWAGFDMVSLANNHTMDYGIKGLKSNIKTARKAGLTYAGAGMNLADARAPGYLETDEGRIAIISVASTFSDEDRATPQRKDMRGKPGLNPLRYKTTYTVSDESMNDLKRIADETGIYFSKQKQGARFAGKYFIVGSETGHTTRPYKKDLNATVQEVKEADRQADWIIVTSHTHEGDGKQPPAFLKTFAHAVIDAGADMVVTTGHHGLRPLEIYKNRPIFYSLGDFTFENETVAKLPAEMYEEYGLNQKRLPGYLQDKRIKESGSHAFTATKHVWESAIPVLTFDNTEEKLSKIVLYPITLGYKKPRPQRGRPRLADKKLGRKIIGGLEKISQSYGTEIEYDAKKNIGRIVIKDK